MPTLNYAPPVPRWSSSRALTTWGGPRAGSSSPRRCASWGVATPPTPRSSWSTRTGPGTTLDASITAPEAAGNAALTAVRIGNREAAQQIIAEMLPDVRADFADHLEELRKMLGPACAKCGALTELGTCTTDPSSAECRFLCSRCMAARRIR